MSGLQSTCLGMGLNVLRKLFCMLGTHSGEDVRAASRQGGRGGHEESKHAK